MPIPGIYEWTKIVLAVVTFLGMAYTQLYGRHITIELVTQKLSARSQKLITIPVLFFSMVFFLIMTWKTAAATLYAYRLGVTWLELQTPLPIWTVKIFLPIGCALLSGELLFEMIHNLRELQNKS
jgi:TRAP-type C4-dicarboxylate transport system permease small subunit